MQDKKDTQWYIVCFDVRGSQYERVQSVHRSASAAQKKAARMTRNIRSVPGQKNAYPLVALEWTGSGRPVKGVLASVRERGEVVR